MIVVKEEQPFALVVVGDFLGSTCSFCLNQECGVSKCTGCHKLSYCNRECQKRDWVNHKKECQILRTLEWVPPMEERLAMRILLTSEEKLAEEAFNGRTWDSLGDNNADAGDYFYVFEGESEHIKKFLEPVKDVEHEEIYQTLMKTRSNRLDLYFNGTDETIVASGIYLGLSAHPESCLPTSQVIFVGRKATLRPFDKNAGYSPDLTISRTRLSPFSQDREVRFKRNYCYSCECPLCTDKEHIMNKIGYSCHVDCCEDGVGIREDYGSERPFKCNKCGAASNISINQMFWTGQYLSWPVIKRSYEEEYLKKLKKCEKIFSPLNYHLVDVYKKAIHSALENHCFKAVEYLEPKVSAAYEYYFPEGHITRSSLFITRSYLTFAGADNFDVNKGYEAAVLTFGEDHPVTQRFKMDMMKYLINKMNIHRQERC